MIWEKTDYRPEVNLYDRTGAAARNNGFFTRKNWQKPVQNPVSPR